MATVAYQISECRATRPMRMDQSSHRYRSRRDPQEPLQRRLTGVAATDVRLGYRRLTVLPRREGWKVNAKRVHRIYVEKGLTVRTKRRKIARHQCLPAPVPLLALRKRMARRSEWLSEHRCRTHQVICE